MSGPEIKGTSALKPQTPYTIEDYLSWDDGLRWELIDGEVYAMSPTPRPKHQEITGELHYQLKHFLKGKTCKPYISPIDVFLENEETVVQPDVLVICDPTKILEKGIKGAPDFIAEILSDSTAMKDLNRKKVLYEAHGVKEYWMVSQDDGTVLAYRLEENRFGHVQEYKPEEPVQSQIFPGFIWEDHDYR